MSHFGPLLSATGLCKSYGPTAALDGADFAISPGEIVAVMGPSGSGKSTLLHCLSGIVCPDEGEVLFEGLPVSRMGDAERSRLRRTAYGFVFQFGQLVPELTCLENAALPLRLQGRRRNRAERAALPWLERLQVADLAQKRPGEVSGGQGQRVAIARALVTGPRVIFADEPTGALDARNGDLVMGLFTEAARETGAAVVLVTHEPRVAVHAHRQVVVRDGRSLPGANMAAGTGGAA